MNRYALALTAAALGILPASSANPEIITFAATLSGSQENPTNASPGTGTARVTVDTALDTMRVEVFFQNLLGTTTASHIHCCAPAGTNAGVATELPLFTGFPTGVTSGTYDHTFDMTLSSSFNPAFVTAQGGVSQAFDALIAGMTTSNAYLNIHTNLFPAGEIRGQLAPVPEMSTWAMMLFGFAALGLVFRRSRQQELAAA